MIAVNFNESSKQSRRRPFAFLPLAFLPRTIALRGLMYRSFFSRFASFNCVVIGSHELNAVPSEH